MCIQVAAAAGSQIHPSAEMEQALQQQDDLFNSLDQDKHSATADGAPDLTGLRTTMHIAFRCGLSGNNTTT